MTKNHLSCAAGAFASVFMVSLPASAAPEAPSFTYRPVAVETQFEGVASSRIDRLEPQLQAAARRELAVHDVELDDDSGTVLVFHVRSVAEGDPEANAESAVSDYGTHIEVLIDGEVAGEEVTLCVSKGEAELVECALSGVPKVLELLPREEVVPPPDAGPPESGSVDGPRSTEAKISPLVWAGAGVLVAGAATLGAGVWMHLYDEAGSAGSVERGLSSERQGYPRSTTVPMLVVGSGLAAAGVALLVTGLVKGARAKKKSTAISPTLSSGFAGVSIQGRF